MEFGAREMMIALGALVALAIMLDVIRRIRNSRYEKIHMPRRKQPVFDDEEIDVFGSELPSGGARVVSYRDEADTEELGKVVKALAEANKPRLSVPVKAPEQSSLNLGEAPVMGGSSQAGESGQPSIPRTASPKNTKKPKKSEQVPVASVVVLHLMAKEGEFFQGEQLLDALLRQGLRYGS
ncbi:MAG: hypothetical protein JKY85_04210, partial [Porticoccus sp.]|nr:hypothetical protein [Porticoccus sp.]